MNRYLILHCHRCRSRTELSTDGRGQLVEHLSHACGCPPVQYQPEQEHGGQPAELRVSRKPRKREPQCVDCGAPISPFARRCEPHREAHHRKVSREYMRQKALQRRVSR